MSLHLVPTPATTHPCAPWCAEHETELDMCRANPVRIDIDAANAHTNAATLVDVHQYFIEGAYEASIVFDRRTGFDFTRDGLRALADAIYAALDTTAGAR